MILDEQKLIIQKYKDGFCLAILMPDNTCHYLHTDLQMGINDVLICRDILLDQELLSNDITVSQDDGYFRLNINLKDANGMMYLFHSRKLSLSDMIYQRSLLVKAD